MAESFSRETLRPAPQKESGTSNELDVQNEWEENTHTQTGTAQVGDILQ